MSINRAQLIVGPSKNTFNSAIFFASKSWEAKFVAKQFEIRPQGFSQPDLRDEDRLVEWDVEPDGRWNTAVIAALWPYLNPTPGGSMTGAGTDRPYVAHGADGGLFSVVAAYVKKMPSLRFSVKKSLIGPVGFRGLIGNSMDPSDASAYATYAPTGSTFADSTFALTEIKTQPYTAAWTGITGFTSVVGEEGFDVDFNIKSKEMPIDGVGTADDRIGEVGVLVKVKPYGPTALQILTALRFQGSGNALGSSRQANAAQFQITGADGINYFTMAKGTLVSAGYRFGDDVLRNGECGIAGTINVAAGVQSAIAVLAAS